MPEDRRDAYLDTIDTAADWTPLDALLDGYAPSFDEWNAQRLLAGQPAGTFDDYLTEIGENHD